LARRSFLTDTLDIVLQCFFRNSFFERFLVNDFCAHALVCKDLKENAVGKSAVYEVDAMNAFI